MWKRWMLEGEQRDLGVTVFEPARGRIETVITGEFRGLLGKSGGCC